MQILEQDLVTLPAASARILCVEDDADIARMLAEVLEDSGFRPVLVGSAVEMDAVLKRASVDLIVLDVMLPGEDGLTICQRLRMSSSIPIIMVTARSEDIDRILGLELGADDYVTKPFSPRELVLRAGSVLRRSRGHSRSRGAEPPQAPEILVMGRLEVDLTAHRARLGGEPLALTGREFDLLAFLMANPGQAFSRAELMQQVWGWSFGDQSTVTVHVRRIRDKVEEEPSSPLLLRTVRGIGYCWDADPSTAVTPPVISNP